jgi:multidrug efflux pump subunit AcrB
MDARKEGEPSPMQSRSTVERKSERELVVTRTFNAPARSVFEAWTKPELFKQWWVPKSFGLSLISYEADVRVGGGYRPTVELENIHRNLSQDKPLIRAILDGAREIAVPAFVSTLCICIVLVPVAFLTGAAKSLFLPLAMAVVFAMLTSYFLSRTLVPTLVRYLLQAESHAPADSPGFFGRIHAGFEARFERLRQTYAGWLTLALANARLTSGVFVVFAVASIALFPLIGRDFFPSVDAGLIRLHVRVAPGTRIEETERLYGQVAPRCARSSPHPKSKT